MPHDVEHLRPEYGFVILTDGQILRGANQSSWDEDNIAQWYARWLCKKQKEGASAQPEVAFRPDPAPETSTSASSSKEVFLYHVKDKETEAVEDEKTVKNTKPKKQKKSKK